MAHAPLPNGARKPLVLPLSWARPDLALLWVGIALHLGLQALFRDWIIEDAAICFAYARNLASGEGWVAMAGGERVEGFSDPLWVGLLALFAWLGLDLYSTAKVLAAGFGAATLPLAWRLAREALPLHRGGLSPLLAPLLLAGSAHHAIWSASALENSLFGLLLVAGALGVLREDRSGGFPWSAVLFFGLALTRPEGVLYGVVAFGWTAILAHRRHQGLRPVLRWAAVFAAPFLAFLLWRIWTFAWPLPMTYYAKLGASELPLWSWDARGWSQLRMYAATTWTGWALWLLPLALLGRTGWRGRVALGVVGLCALLLLIPGPHVLTSLPWWPELPQPPGWSTARIATLGLVAFGLPLLAIGGPPGWRARALTWHLGAVAVFFAVYSDGDWMHGLRWMSLFAPAQAVLLAVGVAEVLRWLPSVTGRPARGPAGWVLAAFALSLWYAPNATWIGHYLREPDMTPESVLRRVRYTTAFADAVFLDEPIRNLDMDMGAHLLWSNHRMVDMAGLVDVPMALHTYGHRDPRHRAFIQEYVFDERRPHFAHVHLMWAELSNFQSYPDWDETFFTLRGYRDGAHFHGGVWARRDLFMAERWPREDRPIRFQGDVEITGFHLVDHDAALGWSMYLELGVSTPRQRLPEDAFTVLASLSDADGNLVTWELPMGVALEGHVQYPPDRWRPGEVFHGRFALKVPRDLPEGAYDLGLVVMGLDGTVWAALPPEDEGDGWQLPEPEDARLAVGEARWPQAVRLVGEDQVLAAIEQGRTEALQLAGQGRCEAAEARWLRARRHLPLHRRWIRQHTPTLKTALSACWTGQAAQAAPDRQVELLARAHTHDHRLPAYVELSEAVAAGLYAQGKAARAAGDHEAAYRLFTDVLRITPYNAWARRYAEEARDHRLGLQDSQGWGRSFGWW